MEDSANTSYNIQTSGSESMWKATSWIGSYIGFYWIFGLVFWSWGMGTNKYWTLFIVYYWFLDGHVNFLLKLFYHDSRPYMRFAKPFAWSCSCDFGKPSGHAQMGLTSYWILFDVMITAIGFKKSYMPQLIENQKENNAEAQEKTYGGYLPLSGKEFTEEESCKKTSWGWLAGILCVLCTFFVGFSRIIRAVHSWNQILLGWIWGINISFLFWFNQKCIMDFIKKTETASKKKCGLILLAIIVAILGTTTLVFGLIDKYWKRPLSWGPYLEIKCDKCEGEYLNTTYEQMSISIVPFIFHLCYLFMPNLKQVQNENLDNFNSREKLSCGKKTAKFLVFLLACVPTLIFYILVGAIKKKIDKDSSRGLFGYWGNSIGL